MYTIEALAIQFTTILSYKMNQIPEAIEPFFVSHQNPPSIGLHHTPNGFGAYSSSATRGDILWAENGQNAVNRTYNDVDGAGLTFIEAREAAYITMDVVRAYCHRHEPSGVDRKIRASLLAMIESRHDTEEACITALAIHVAFTYVNFLSVFGYRGELIKESTYSHFFE